MIKLLNVNFYRLKKSCTFWICLVIMGLLGVFLYFNNYTPNCVGCTNQLGDVFFEYAVFNGFLIPIFVCIFVGSDYSNGTIRNKIISGQSKKNIYLSNLLTSIFVGSVYCLIYIICITITGIIFDNSFVITFSKFIYILLDTLLLNISFCSLFNFIAMLIDSKAISSIFSLSFTLWSLLISNDIALKLSEASGFKKIILQFVYDAVPLSQSMQLYNLTDNYLKLAIYMIITIILINLFGIILFKHKELK